MLKEQLIMLIIFSSSLILISSTQKVAEEIIGKKEASSFVLKTQNNQEQTPIFVKKDISPPIISQQSEQIAQQIDHQSIATFKEKNEITQIAYNLHQQTERQNQIFENEISEEVGTQDQKQIGVINNRQFQHSDQKNNSLQNNLYDQNNIINITNSDFRQSALRRSLNSLNENASKDLNEHLIQSNSNIQSELQLDQKTAPALNQQESNISKGSTIEKETSNESTHSDRIESISKNQQQYNNSQPHKQFHYSPSDPEFYICLLVALALCLFAGICSGLTVGYLSIDDLSLELKMKNGTDEEKRAATKIFPILQKHHILLSTLLIANALALETLPIFLEKALPAAVAIVLSTIFVVLFSEIIPQAYCTGPNQIQIAEKMAPVVKLLILIFSCLAYPMGNFLDWLLGTHSATRFPRKDLKALIELHGDPGVEKENRQNRPQADEENSDQRGNFFNNPSGLGKEEVVLIKAQIDLRDKSVASIMVPTSSIFMLSSKERIQNDVLNKILQKGYKQIPIHEHRNKNNILGIIRSKELIDINNEQNQYHTIIECVNMYPPLIVSNDTSLLEMLMIFQEKKQSIAFVSEENRKEKHQNKNSIYFSKKQLIVDSLLNKANLVGLVTLKDIFEEILNRELKDDDLHLTLGSQKQPTRKEQVGRFVPQSIQEGQRRVFEKNFLDKYQKQQEFEEQVEAEEKM